MATQDDAAGDVSNLGTLIALGWVGAAGYGVTEAASVVFGGRLAPDSVAIVVLLALSLIVTGGLGAVPVAIVGASTRTRPRGTAWALLGGVATAASLAFAVVWFSDPPPFTDAWPLQGNPLAYLILGIALPAAIVAGVNRAAALHRAGPFVVAGALLLAALGAIVASAPPGGPSSDGTKRPNVVIVTMDTTRYDRFADHRVETDAFDRVADGGARFSQAYSDVPVTGPSHASMMTGAPPWETGLLLNGRAVPADRPMLAEVLHTHGYSTAGFVSAWVLDGKLGYARGFDVYDDDFRWLPGAGRILPGRLLEMLVRHKDGEAYLLERRGDHTMDRALGWLDAQPQDKPFFVWIHLFDPHGSYTPPPPFDTRYTDGGDPYDPTNTSMSQVGEVPAYLAPSLKGITDLDYVKAQYDGEIAFTDHQVGRLLDWLELHNHGDDTLVILTADHGEGLGEDGEWFNHGDWLYEHDLHVPLAIRLPGKIPAQTQVDQPVELIDLAPTVMSLLDLPELPTHHGSSMVPLFSGATGQGFARSACMDREANRASRQADPTFKPKWRMASVRGPGLAVVDREMDGLATRVWVNGKEGTLPEADPLLPLETTYSAEALKLFSAQTQAGAVGDDERKLLEQLGYIDP